MKVHLHQFSKIQSQKYDGMEWSKKPSHATVPLKWEVKGRPVYCPSLILYERGTPDLQRTPELHAGGAEAAGGQD